MEVHFRGKFITKTIQELSRCEVFVYGTDMRGDRVGRAEQLACERFGAVQGQKSGPQGQCYAIPIDIEKPKAMIPYVVEFIDYVKEHPNNRFLITRMGCGNGKIDDRDKLLAPLFDEIFPLPNVVFSKQWGVLLIDNLTFPERPAAPEVVNEEVLMDLCQRYRYQISANDVASLPYIRVRYVIGKDKFGYASFGDFFFQGMNMYVFPPKEDEKPKDEGIPSPTIRYTIKKIADGLQFEVPEKFPLKSKTGHIKIYTRDEYREKLSGLDDETLLGKLNRQDGVDICRQLAYEEAMHRGIPEYKIDVSGTLQAKWDALERKRIDDDSARGCALDFFRDECWNRTCPQKVIFAGVETPFKDSNGKSIFTGDVVKLEDDLSEEYLAVGAMCDNDGCGQYCFILDNHSWPLTDCQQHHQLTRVGTVFYQLKDDDFLKVNQRTMQFNGWRDTKEDRQNKALMAKFTPNFAQDFWEYQMLEVIGAEFDWRGTQKTDNPCG